MYHNVTSMMDAASAQRRCEIDDKAWFKAPAWDQARYRRS